MSLLVAALLTSMAWQAPVSLVSEWRELCAAHRSDFSASLEEAERRGWMIAPDAMTSDLAGAAGLNRPQIRIRTDPGSLRTLMVGSIAGGYDGLPATMRVRFCAVGSLPIDSGAGAELAAFAAVPPNKAIGANTGDIAYMYHDGPVGRRAIFNNPDDQETKQLASDGGLSLVALHSDGKFSLVIFAVPTESANVSAP